MCNPVMVGMAIGAGMSAIQGGDMGDILLGAAIGGATAGMAAPSGQAFTAFSSGTTGATGGIFSSVGGSFFAEGVTTAAQAGMMGGTLTGLLSPQQQNYNLANTGMAYTPQPYSSQHATVTGSGGRQAAAVLASEIKQAKSLRQRQAGVADYGLGMDVAGTGLQIA